MKLGGAHALGIARRVAPAEWLRTAGTGLAERRPVLLGAAFMLLDTAVG
ncbi:hypothetical protein HNR23_003501 [Nocardiopsis mwathae]|uniref:Uncharacterized protein n=1 Tax=Nocardiopsis mwathae TaxID=1472723 RepID=A0A7W9YLN5_9ACTN|nr:hypothetical protein [Nocardiopsis mwathae]MBB6173441.1 hypothetical protein [Nocardiopsis mwathae]